MTSGRRPGRRGRFLRYLGDAFAVGGMARGTSHGLQGGGPGDRLAARVAAQEHLRHGDEGRSEGLLDRVPGVVLIVAAAAIVVAVYVLAR